MKHLLPTLLGVAVMAIPHAFYGQTCTGTGPLTGTGANSATIGTVAWTNPNNASGLTTDGSFATASAATITLFGSGNSNYLTLTNLGFSIPPTNIICGVTVSVNRQASAVLSLGTISDNDVRLTQAGAVFTGTGANHAQAGNWPNTLTAANYGSNSDIWGAGTLTPVQVNSSTFGVAFSVHFVSILSVAFSALVDNITVTVYSRTSGPLPITLQSFTATRAEGGNLISWTAGVSGIANNFAVERSSDGKNWTTIATIAASNDQSAYQYLDTDPLPGTNYYRLHLLSNDGSGSYSTVAGIATQSVPYIRCYPNPFISTIHVSSPHPIGKVLIKDLQGKTLLTNEPGKDTRDLDLPASGFPPGVYFIQVDGVTTKLIKETW